MLEFGIEESNFRPIYSRKHNEILGYQLTPKNMLPSITENNAEKQIFYCEHCKTKKFEVDDSYFDTYNRLGCPVYISKEAFDKMYPYFTEIYGNPNSQHVFGREAVKAVDEARDTVASLIGAKPHEVYFTSGGTEGDNWALRGSAHALAHKGKHLIISPIEHAAMLSTA